MRNKIITIIVFAIIIVVLFIIALGGGNSSSKQEEAASTAELIPLTDDFHDNSIDGEVSGGIQDISVDDEVLGGVQDISVDDEVSDEYETELQEPESFKSQSLETDFNITDSFSFNKDTDSGEVINDINIRRQGNKIIFITEDAGSVVDYLSTLDSLQWNDIAFDGALSDEHDVLTWTEGGTVNALNTSLNGDGNDNTVVMYGYFDEDFGFYVATT